MYVTSITSSTAGKATAGKSQEERLMGACQDFEAIFVRQMLQEMRKAVPKSKLLDGGLQQDIYQDMFDSVMADTASRREGFGIAKALYNHFQPVLGAQKKP